jgi:dTDP-4-dehydrorhamnose 3,5-epimerase
VRIRETGLGGVLLLEPDVFEDERGFFLECFNEQRFAASGRADLPRALRQINHSRSMHDVLRGLHFQLDRPQGKLIHVVRGAIFDVAVDIRAGSPTFGKWTSICLSDDAPSALWIPPGFAHGFCVVSEVADVIYGCTDVYVHDDDRGIRWNDPQIAIDWPTRTPVLSARDERLPTLAESSTALPTYHE